MFKNMIQLGKKATFLKKYNFNFNINLNPVKKFSSNISNDSFVTGTSGVYIEKMYENWLKDPKSVHLSWDVYFTNLESGLDHSQAFQSPPTLDRGK